MKDTHHPLPIHASFSMLMMTKYIFWFCMLMASYYSPMCKKLRGWSPLWWGRFSGYYDMWEGSVILGHDCRSTRSCRGGKHDLLHWTIVIGNRYSTSFIQTPAVKKCFHATKESPPLDDAGKQKFHTIVAKLLCLAKLARPDLLTATSFLCRRVKQSTKTDQPKLLRLLGYLQSTKLMKYNIKPTQPLGVMTYIDAEFATHDDSKFQITFRWSCFFSQSISICFIKETRLTHQKPYWKWAGSFNWQSRVCWIVLGIHYFSSQ